MIVRLTVTDGPHRGLEFSFGEHATFVVGRGSKAHFRLPRDDRYFSRVHFLVEINPPLCRLVDMASTNGTFVNGRRVEVIDLKAGDRIRGGKTTLEVSVDGDDDREVPGASAEESRASSVEADPATPGSSDSGTSPGSDPPPAPERPPDPPAKEWPPQTIVHVPEVPRVPGYRIDRELGRGGMGVVSLAWRSGERVPVALKTIAPANSGSPEAVARFLREAGLLRRLEHPNIVGFRDVGKAEGQFYFAMEYVDGPSAHDLVERSGPMASDRAVDLACQALDALAYAHDRGFVHRDVKPRNLLVASVLDREILKLADFGLARVYLDSPLSGLTLTGEIAGTFGYMAPEQVTDFRLARPPADLYAVGASLYYLLTGHRPYRFPPGISRQILMLLNEEPTPIVEHRPDLDPGLARVVHRSLADDPIDRFPDASAMREALLPFAGPR